MIFYVSFCLQSSILPPLQANKNLTSVQDCGAEFAMQASFFIRQSPLKKVQRKVAKKWMQLNHECVMKNLMKGHLFVQTSPAFSM